MAEQDQQGGPEDGIGAAAQQAYTDALEGGATPTEAFDAAAGAAQQVATDMGVPQGDFDAAVDAASGAFQEAMEGGASPGEAFGSAMQAAEEASPPDTQMEPPQPPPPNGDMPM